MPSSTFVDRGVDPIDHDYDDTESCGWCMEDLRNGERHPVCDRLTDARTCETCKTVFMDSEPDEPCERCGGPLGVAS